LRRVFACLRQQLDDHGGLLLGTATTLWLDFLVIVAAAVAAITAASALLGRLTR
jgi:ABC-2 type transport system permease protein